MVRRDNIGDLVCTTPLLAALRRACPQAWIGALVNSYSAAVLDRNPDLDEVLVYTKLKHLEPGASALGALAARIGELWRLRRRRLDCVVLANPAEAPRTLALARALAPQRIVSLPEEKLARMSGAHQRGRAERAAAGVPDPARPARRALYDDQQQPAAQGRGRRAARRGPRGSQPRARALNPQA